MSTMNSSSAGFSPAELSLASADKTGTMTAVYDHLRSSMNATDMPPYIKNKLLLLAKDDMDTLMKWIEVTPWKRPFLQDALKEGELFCSVGDSPGPVTPAALQEREHSAWTYLRTLLEVECYMPYGEAFLIEGRACLDKLAQLPSKSRMVSPVVRKFIDNRWCRKSLRYERARGAGEWEMADDDDSGTIRLFLAVSTSTDQLPAYVKNAMMANLSDVVLLKWLGKAPVLCPHISNALYERSMLHQLQDKNVLPMLPRPRTQMEVLSQACDTFDEHNPVELLQAMLEVESYNPYGMVDPTFMHNTACRHVENVLAPHWALPKVRRAVLFIFRRWQYWPGRWCGTSSPLAKFMKVCWAHEDPIWREFFVPTRDEHDDLERGEIFNHWQFHGLQFDKCWKEVGKGGGDGSARTLAFLCQRATDGMDRGILWYGLEEALRNASTISPLLLAVWQKVVQTHSSIPGLPDHLKDNLRQLILKDPETHLRLWHAYDVTMDSDILCNYLKMVLKNITRASPHMLAKLAQGHATTVQSTFRCKMSLEPHKSYEGVRLIMGILESMAVGATRFMTEVLGDAVKALYVLLRVQSNVGKLYLQADDNGDLIKASRLQIQCTQLMYAVHSAEQVVLKVARWDSGGVALAIQACACKGRKYRRYMEYLPSLSKMKLLDVFCDRYYEKGEVMMLEKLLKELLKFDFNMALKHGVFTYGLRLETPWYSLEPMLRNDMSDDDATEEDEPDLLLARVRNGLTDVSDTVRKQVFATQGRLLGQDKITSAHEFVYFCKTFDPLPLPSVCKNVFQQLKRYGDWIFDALTVRANFRRRYLGRHLHHVVTGIALKHESLTSARKHVPERFHKATCKALVDANIRRLINVYL